jgi:AraC family transcriptional regulator, regulatory protein of adaptative response / methylated-DNA-[protein]-cysteine methyltransferase
MINEQHADYQRIEQAIQFIETHFKQQPDLAEIAAQVHLSEFHFNRMFARWAGTTPQRFMHFLTKEYAKSKISENTNLLETAWQSGLSGSSRLHDLFVNYEALTPAEYKSKGAGLTIAYGSAESMFGHCFVAQTDRGITDIRFYADEDLNAELAATRDNGLTNADFVRDDQAAADVVARIFSRQPEASQPISMLLRGTNFQIKVWEALLRIPFGGLVSYDDIAQYIGQPTAQRAVGTAIGSNRLAFLIPCHRVLQKTGGIGGYRWGTPRKRAMLAWEAGLQSA